jgi:hypothetical protein
MRPTEAILGMGAWAIKENVGGVNLTKIYCKNFVNVTMYPQYNNKMII